MAEKWPENRTHQFWILELQRSCELKIAWLNVPKNISDVKKPWKTQLEFAIKFGGPNAGSLEKSFNKLIMVENVPRRLSSKKIDSGKSCFLLYATKTPRQSYLYERILETSYYKKQSNRNLKISNILNEKY